MLLAMAAAFGLTKFPFKSSKVFTSIFAFGLMISVHAVIIPLFQLEAKLGMVNTRLGVIIPYVAFNLPISIMIAISYVKGIPNALIESAEIDGAKVPLHILDDDYAAVRSRHRNDGYSVFLTALE